MAATAYASLVSLLNTIDQIHTHPLVSTFFDIDQNKSISEKANFLVDFMEKHSDAESREVEDLVRRIAAAAHEAEDMIEVYVADRVRGRESPSFLPDLQMIIEEMESIKEVIKVKDETGKSPSALPDLHPSSSSSPPASDEGTIMVGFDNYVEKLMWDLTGHDVGRKIISITGMCGKGKTTLARNIYENPLTKCHFNVRVWITVSQDCTARKVYLQALSCLRGRSINRDTASDQQISDELYKALYNRRYLIILDDVWSTEIWNKINFFFPENGNGSRIVVTTREIKLVDKIGSSALALKLLSDINSWKLFCVKTFPKRDFPPELEEVGKKIVKKCGGLPLAISVIGGLLGKSPQSQEYWEKIAKDRSLFLNLEENNPTEILHLSYKYLPVWLKPCFLHFGLYPEDFKITVCTIIKLWVAEGFIKANRGQSMEEVAESYFYDLVERNLLLLHSSSLPIKKRCSAHDLVRGLCIKIGEREKFFCIQRSIDGDCHFIADQTTAPRFYPQESHAYESPSILNPRIVPAGERDAPIKTRLLRVLCRGERSPYYDALQEVNLRFVEDHCYSKEHDYLRSSLLSQFWSLQTIIVTARNVVFAPAVIWKMPQLRHIDVTMICLPDPPPLSDDDVCVLQNLHTLKRVHNLIFTEVVCKRIPDIEELCISCDYRSKSGAFPFYHLQNVGCFNKLESLRCECYVPEYHLGNSLESIKFPSCLKELTLVNCMLEWSYMAVIASLPHLQSLDFQENAVAGTEWIFVDEKFLNLKRINFFRCGRVTKWIAESSNFPVLEKLVICELRKLDEVPSGIGEIPTLQRIFLWGCSESANISAVEILHEQERFENLGLRVEIYSDEPELLSEKIQELGLTCQNLVIDRNEI